MRGALLGVACAVVLAGCSEERKANIPALTKGDYEGRIAGWVLEDYSDESLIHGSDPADPTFGKFSSMVSVINQQKIAAAKHALDYGGCDRAESVLFSRRSSTADSLVYTVDCSNGRRLTISSKNLGDAEGIKSDAEKSISQGQAAALCKGLILSKYPSRTIEYHDILGTSYYKAPANGNVRLILDFDVDPAGEALEKLRAQCFFEPTGKAELNISRR